MWIIFIQYTPKYYFWMYLVQLKQAWFWICYSCCKQLNYLFNISNCNSTRCWFCSLRYSSLAISPVDQLLLTLSKRHLLKQTLLCNFPFIASRADGVVIDSVLALVLTCLLGILLIWQTSTFIPFHIHTYFSTGWPESYIASQAVETHSKAPSF